MVQTLFRWFLLIVPCRNRDLPWNWHRKFIDSPPLACPVALITAWVLVLAMVTGPLISIRPLVLSVVYATL